MTISISVKPRRRPGKNRLLKTDEIDSSTGIGTALTFRLFANTTIHGIGVR
ncbi:MAG: hypothetical protein R3C19_00625 [Planctomycetaceae bacterium]